jgi:hypothetical protein
MGNKQSILDIVIKTIKQGTGDKEVVKGLTNVKTNINATVGAFAALAGGAYAVDKLLDATSGVYLKYGQNVREVKLALGLTSEETSRVIALTDDLGISIEDLTSTIKKNADNTNFSIDGLARNSEAYLALADAEDRAAFAKKNYGKQWLEFSKLLEKGPEQVRAMAAAVDEGHIFDDEDLAQIEAYRIAQDKLRDSGESLAMSIGSTLVPMQTRLIEGLDIYINLARSEEETYTRSAIYHNAINMALEKEAKANETATDATEDHTAAMDGASESAEELSKKYTAQLGLIEKIGKASAKQVKEIAYNNLLAEASIDGLTEAEQEMVEQAGIGLGIFSQANVDTAETMDELVQKVLEGKMSVAEYNAEIARIERNVQITFTQSQVGLTVAGVGQGFCFIAGTQISMADGSTKAIEDVKAGDEVSSYDTERETLLTAKVERTYHHTGEQMSHAYLLINKRIGVTPNHSLYVSGEWRAAFFVRNGDWLTTKDGPELVVSVETVFKEVQTYNLHIDHESHNYFADGILAHNKTTGGIARGPGDGTADTFLAPMANGEGVINSRGMQIPGMEEFLRIANSGLLGRGGGANNSRSIHIENLTIVARGGVNDVLEEIG